MDKMSFDDWWKLRKQSPHTTVNIPYDIGEIELERRGKMIPRINLAPRAWYHNCMFNVQSIHFTTRTLILYETELSRRIYVRFEDIEALLRPIGQKDRNDKEIYEGDMVNFYTSYEREGTDEYEGPTVVKWIEKEAGFWPFTLNNRWRCDVEDVEVIGNIYENKDILEDLHLAQEAGKDLADMEAKGEKPVPWKDVKKGLGLEESKS